MPDKRKKLSAKKSSVAPKLYDLGGRDGVPDVREAGFKAHNLMRMAAMGLPVPQGFVLSTGWYHAMELDKGAKAQLVSTLQTGIRDLERRTGLGFGSSRRPLLVSVRSGAPVSMPGMMETVLNIGLNEASLSGLLRLSGDHRLAWDSYRRLIQAFAEIVANAPAAPYEQALDEVLRKSGVRLARHLDFRSLRELAQTYLGLYREHSGESFPQDPYEQLAAAAQAVFASWGSAKAIEYRRLTGLSGDLGTAVAVQRMVFGNAGGVSGAGVGFTRDPSTGENRPYLDWLPQAQGEDIVSGRRRISGESAILPWLARKLTEVGDALEKNFSDVQEYEYTVENGELFMLQTRTAKRTALASLRVAVEMADSGLITQEEALARLSAVDLDNILIRHVHSALPPIGQAISAGIGVASGPAAFSVESAQAFAARGTPAILVRNDVATSDIAGIAVVAGVLTASGGRTSHAAVVARQMGKVCLVSCVELTIDQSAKRAMLEKIIIDEGMTISLDGDTGLIYADTPEIATERPEALIARVDGWRAEFSAQQ